MDEAFGPFGGGGGGGFLRALWCYGVLGLGFMFAGKYFATD